MEKIRMKLIATGTFILEAVLVIVCLVFVAVILYLLFGPLQTGVVYLPHR